MLSRMGRTAGEVVGSTVMKGSKVLCHKASVPPQAFLWSRAREGRNESSLLRWWQKSGREAIARAESHWKSCGSERKMRAGEWREAKYERDEAPRRAPSIFQEITVML